MKGTPPVFSRAAAARYLAAAGGTAVLVVLLVCAVNWIGIKQGLVGWQAMRLLDYQLAKVEGGAPVDLVLLGDSTLGNAVDAAAWSAATGLHVESLALTGTYGFEGSLNMLRRVLRHQQPRAVVIMQSLDMMTRHTSYQGLLYTAERIGDLRGVEPWALLPTLANLELLSAMITAKPGNSAGADADYAAHDYVPQRPTSGPGAHKRQWPRVLDAADIRPAKAAFLRQIAGLCQSSGIACVYAHGPYGEPGCSGSGPYIQAATAAIEAAGLPVVAGTPVCVPQAALGDSEDHVRPDLKQGYSEEFRRLIGRALARVAWPDLQRASAE